MTIAVADDFPNFSICGLPYYLSRETPDWRDLAHRTQFPGINVLRQHKAESVDAARKSVAIRNAAGEKIVRYDRLIVATGATPIRPNFPGGALDGVFSLHTMDDSFAVHRHLTERQAERAVLVGAGYIGLVMADALKQRGLDLTLLGRSKTLLPTVDPALGLMVAEELERNGVRVLTGISTVRIEKAADGKQLRLSVIDSAGGHHLADLVIFAGGVRPNSDLAHRAGAKLGTSGAIAVTRRMETSSRCIRSGRLRRNIPPPPRQADLHLPGHDRSQARPGRRGERHWRRSAVRRRPWHAEHQGFQSCDRQDGAARS